VWEVRAYVGRDERGRPLQRSRTVRGDRRAALAALAALQAEVSAEGGARRSLAKPPETFGELAERWLEARRPSLRPATRASYESHLRHLVLPALGPLRLREVTPDLLEQCFARWSTSHSLTTAHHAGALVRSIMRQGERWGYLAHDPTRRVTLPPLRPPQEDPLTPEQVRRLLSAAVAHDAEHPGGISASTLVALAVLTGARRGELAALRWSDVDDQARVLTIRRAISSGDGDTLVLAPKTGRARRMALGTIGVAIVERRRAEQQAYAAKVGVPLDPDPWLLGGTARADRPPSTSRLGSTFEGVCKHAGVPTHLHALRHFAATHLLASSVDARSVAERLGHADPSMTLGTYAAALPATDERSAELLGALLVNDG